MYASSEQLREQVIRPALEYLDMWTAGAEETLLRALREAPELGLFSKRPEGLGLFRITPTQHRDIWDRYLAFQPDLASRVRGLASQHAFLANPDRELQTNLGYCTAIAWLLYQRSRVEQSPAPREVISA